jgi:hypothetical protein
MEPSVAHLEDDGDDRVRRRCFRFWVGNGVHSLRAGYRL